ncbi:hypothetical protein BJ742DRAFT_867534 [Cladochytrium replicatum]|nr:hypothetical protein BJ742DRAFT_867534 [Cladochytrium replicatum]
MAGETSSQSNDDDDKKHAMAGTLTKKAQSKQIDLIQIASQIPPIPIPTRVGNGGVPLAHSIPRWIHYIRALLESDRLPGLDRIAQVLRVLNDGGRRKTPVVERSETKTVDGRSPGLRYVPDPIQSRSGHQLLNKFDPKLFTWTNLYNTLAGGARASLSAAVVGSIVASGAFTDSDELAIESNVLALLYLACYGHVQETNSIVTKMFSPILERIRTKDLVFLNWQSRLGADFWAEVFTDRNLRFHRYVAVSNAGDSDIASNIVLNEYLEYIRIKKLTTDGLIRNGASGSNLGTQPDVQRVGSMLACSFYSVLEFLDRSDYYVVCNLSILSEYGAHLPASWFTSEFVNALLYSARKWKSHLAGVPFDSKPDGTSLMCVKGFAAAISLFGFGLKRKGEVIGEDLVSEAIKLSVAVAEMLLKGKNGVSQGVVLSTITMLFAAFGSSISETLRSEAISTVARMIYIYAPYYVGSESNLIQASAVSSLCQQSTSSSTIDTIVTAFFTYPQTASNLSMCSDISLVTIHNMQMETSLSIVNVPRRPMDTVADIARTMQMIQYMTFTRLTGSKEREDPGRETKTSWWSGWASLISLEGWWKDEKAEEYNGGIVPEWMEAVIQSARRIIFAEETSNEVSSAHALAGLTGIVRGIQQVVASEKASQKSDAGSPPKPSTNPSKRFSYLAIYKSVANSVLDAAILCCSAKHTPKPAITCAIAMATVSVVSTVPDIDKGGRPLRSALGWLLGGSATRQQSLVSLLSAVLDVYVTNPSALALAAGSDESLQFFQTLGLAVADFSSAKTGSSFALGHPIGRSIAVRWCESVAETSTKSTIEEAAGILGPELGLASRSIGFIVSWFIEESAESGSMSAERRDALNDVFVKLSTLTSDVFDGISSAEGLLKPLTEEALPFKDTAGHLLRYFRTLLFSITVIGKRAVDSIAEIEQIPDTQQIGRQIVLNLLQSFANLHFVTLRFGSDGFKAWNDTVIRALEWMRDQKHPKRNHGNKALRSLSSGAEDNWLTEIVGQVLGMNTITPKVDLSRIKKSRLCFGLFAARHAIRLTALDEGFVQHELLPRCQPYLTFESAPQAFSSTSGGAQDDTFLYPEDRDVFELSHSMYLTVLENAHRYKSLVRSFAGWYIDTLLRGYPEPVDFDLLRRCFAFTVKSLTGTSQPTSVLLGRSAKLGMKEGQVDEDDEEDGMQSGARLRSGNGSEGMPADSDEDDLENSRRDGDTLTSEEQTEPVQDVGMVEVEEAEYYAGDLLGWACVLRLVFKIDQLCKQIAAAERSVPAALSSTPTRARRAGSKTGGLVKFPHPRASEILAASLPTRLYIQREELTIILIDQIRTVGNRALPLLLETIRGFLLFGHVPNSIGKITEENAPEGENSFAGPNDVEQDQSESVGYGIKATTKLEQSPLWKALFDTVATPLGSDYTKKPIVVPWYLELLALARLMREKYLEELDKLKKQRSSQGDSNGSLPIPRDHPLRAKL